MRTTLTLKGSMTALVTPFKNGGIDEDAFREHVDWQIKSGTTGLVPVGTTGESPTLSHEEHGRVVEICVEAAKGRVPVIAGAGSNNTTEAIDLARHAEKVGADAVLVVTPYYNKPTQEGLYLHHKAIAEAVAIPQILYNVPGRTGCDMLPATAARISHLPNVIGIKEATGKLERLAEILNLAKPGFLLYSGDDATGAEFCLRGGHGVISVTANIAPRLMHEMIAAALAGDRAKALALDAKLAGLHRDLFIESNPIPAKWAAFELGLLKKGIRLPLTWLSEECRVAVRDAMAQAEVI